MHCTLQLAFSFLVLAAFSSQSPIEMPASTNSNAPTESDPTVNNEPDMATAPDTFAAGSNVFDWMKQANSATNTDDSTSSAIAMQPMPLWQSAGFLWPMQLLQSQVTSASSDAAVMVSSSPTASATLAAQQLAAMQSFGSMAGLQDAIAGFQTVASSLSDASLRATVIAHISAMQGFQTSMQAQINQIKQSADASGAMDSLNAVISQLQTGSGAWTSESLGGAIPSTAATASWDAVGFFQHLQQLQAIADTATDAETMHALSRQMQAIDALNSLTGLQQAVRDLLAVEEAVDAAVRRVLSSYILVLQGFQSAFGAQVRMMQQALPAVTDWAVVGAISSRISTMQFGGAAMQDWNSGGVWTPTRRDSSCGYCCWESEHHGNGEHHVGPSRRDAH
ncbi:hypothetical protein HDU82_005926 [Entophlyctis luteolus]|nr:hypothetical protein HDU82_005926 [Entophlyctis luteolus]